MDNNANTGTSGGQSADNNAGNNGQSGVSQSSGGIESDPVIAKHLDIAIEAQDGKTDKPAEKKEGEDTGATSGDDDKRTGTDKPDDKKDSKGAATDKTTQQQPDKKGEADKKQTSGAKDLVTAEGTFKAGVERRLYEQRELARNQLTTERQRVSNLTNEINQLRAKVEATEKSVQSVHGMSPQDVALGAQILKDLKTNPVGAVQKLLAELTAKGYKIEGIAAGVDTMAVQRMLDERLGTQADKEPTEAEIKADAEKEAAQFFSQHPDAKQHEAIIARTMLDHPGLSVEDAYFGLREAFIEKGLDWSRPLREQLDNAQQKQDDKKDDTKPLPNGGGNVDPNANAKADEKIVIAHESESWDDIIRASMKEAGLAS